MSKILCKCGCGQKRNDTDIYGRKRYYIYGHCNRGRYIKGRPVKELPIEEIIDLYKNKTITELAKIYNVSQQTIRRRIRDKTKIRSMSENTKLAWKNNNYKLKNPGMNWKGGRRIDSSGYIIIYKPNYPNTRKNFIKEHRYVMEQKIGRSLTRTELVHHKNGIKTDNRIENLAIVVRKNHYGKIICPCCNNEYYIK